MLSAAAGFAVAKPYPDLAGIDLHIAGTSEVQDDYPLAKVQVKTWSTPKGDDLVWHYDRLNEKQFNALAGPRIVPAFLFLIVVPPDPRDYALADAQRLQLCYAAYWASLADRPKIPEPDPNRHVPVTVPRTNLLTVESLTSLCKGTVRIPDTSHAPLARTP